MGVSPYKNRDGSVVWYCDYRDNGRRKREKFNTRQEAEAAMLQRQAAMAKSKILDIPVKQKIPFHRYKDEFIKFSKAQKKHRTHESHLLSVTSLAFFDSFNLSDITVADIEAYKTRRLSAISPASVNRELACLKYMLNRAEELGLTDNTVARQIKLFREPQNRIRYLTTDEIKKLLNAITLDYLRLIVIIALNTGLRKGEILSLRWKHIDLSNRLLFVETVEYKKKEDSPKSGKSRIVPINETLYEELYKWKTSPDKEAKLFNVVEIKRSFRTALKNANIKNFRFHDLRHTFASHLVMAGVDLTTVCSLLGHSSIQMTMKYAHLSPDHRKVAVSTLDSRWTVPIWQIIALTAKYKGERFSQRLTTNQ